jgi:hypothetical protein
VIGEESEGEVVLRRRNADGSSRTVSSVSRVQRCVNGRATYARLSLGGRRKEQRMGAAVVLRKKRDQRKKTNKKEELE